jgi:hypothetical protein
MKDLFKEQLLIDGTVPFEGIERVGSGNEKLVESLMVDSLNRESRL